MAGDNRSDQAQANYLIWRGAGIPAAVVTVISCVIAAFTVGTSGFLGSLLSAVIVAIFFSISLLVAQFTKDVNPVMTMALAVFSYFTKLLFVALFLIAVTRLTDPEVIHRRSFGVSAILITLAWLGGEVRAFLSLRLHLELPDKGNDKGLPAN